MNKNNQPMYLENVIRQPARAWAILRGSADHPELFGYTRFYDSSYGTVVVAEIHGLPALENECDSPIFAFHIHEGELCTGNASDPFANVRTHYNPRNCPHPYHAGDMPPLFSANGNAFSVFLTDRFNVDEIIGKTVIIHSSVDDFSTQPSGNAGEKIACGEIVGRMGMPR